MSNRTNPHAKDPCPHCRGWGFYRVSHDPDETGDCLSCGGSGEQRKEPPVTVKGLSHSGDPLTSGLAVIQLDPEGRASLKDALLLMLGEKPMTADELTSAYVSRAETNQWPIYVDHHNVKRRLSELHTKHHVIRESGETRPSRMGRASTVWTLSVPLEEARVIVMAA